MHSSNPYSAPQTSFGDIASAQSATNVWRSGKLLVVSHGSCLPAQCIKCNLPTLDKRKEFNLTWYSPVAYLGLLLGPLPFIIIALLTQKKMTIDVGVCPEHRRKRRNASLIGWSGAAAGIGLMILAAMAKGIAVGLLLISGTVLLLVAIVYGIVAARIIWPRRIDKRFAWVNGACQEYMDALPEFPWRNQR